MVEMLAARNQAMDRQRPRLQPELVAEFKHRYDNLITEVRRENPAR